MPVEERELDPIIPRGSISRKTLKPEVPDKVVENINKDPETVKVLSKRCDIDKLPYGVLNFELLRECNEYGAALYVELEDSVRILNSLDENNKPLVLNKFKDDKDLNYFLVTLRDILKFYKMSSSIQGIVNRVMKNEKKVMADVLKSPFVVDGESKSDENEQHVNQH